MKSSRKPIAAQASVDEEDGQRRQRVAAEGEERDRRRDDDQHAAHRRRALLGDVAAAGPSSRMCWPSSLAAQELDEPGAEQDRDQHRDDRGDDDADSTPAPLRALPRRRSSPAARDALTSTQSPGLQQLVAARRRLVAPATLRTDGTPSAVAVVRARAGRRRPARRRRARGAARRPRGGSAARRRPSSAISPSTATRRRAAGAVGEVLERGAHRQRVRVVRVVDQQPAARRARAPRRASARTRSHAAPSCARSSGRPSAS